MLAEYVKSRRAELGISLAQLAMRTDLSKGHLHHIEIGRASNLTVDGILALSAGLQCSAVELFKKAAGFLPSGS